MLIVGVAVMAQSSFGHVHASVRLDGAIAGLAIAAVAGVGHMALHPGGCATRQ